MNDKFRGIGMTSQRSRDRLIDQLREMGIQSERVLEVMRNMPRHIFIDEARTVLAAEVAHAMRNEFARHLVDIVHRRTMVGLDADQGVGLARRMAKLAADEADWDRRETARQLEALESYNARLHVIATQNSN